MYDVEKVVSARIERDRRYTSPLVSLALSTRAQIEIKTLKTAPRDEVHLRAAIRLLQARISKFDNVLFLERWYAELEALNWLLAVVKLKDTYHTDSVIV